MLNAMPTSDRHRRPVELSARGAHFVAAYQELSDIGVAPAVFDVSPAMIVTQLGEPLEAWLHGRSESDLAGMARLIYDRVLRMHQHGICHRDLHAANIVVIADEPFFVDPDFASRCDPSLPPYDLYGPGPSKVDVPEAHLAYPPNRGGVWWDCDAEVPALHIFFGRVATVGTDRP